MVGDTIADLKMGKVAGLRASVAVMTGVGTRETLAQYSDYFVSFGVGAHLHLGFIDWFIDFQLEDISELPQLISKTMNEDTKRGWAIEPNLSLKPNETPPLYVLLCVNSFSF